MMLRRFLKRWREEQGALAALEASFVFPILCFLLLGVYDMGNALLVSQKVIRASQVTGDLVSREREIDQGELEEAILGGELAMAPGSIVTYGVDIVSIEFDDDANPEIVWRETRGMSANANVFDAVEPLAEEGEGVIVVTVEYTFQPLFAGFMFGDITMQEMAFTRGRKSTVVNRV